MKVAVIGAGTYGSYIIDSLIEKYPHCEITLFEVGTKSIKTEEEIGFKSNIVTENYNGLTKGRFFGFGGTSTKWGGQILLYSENDFDNPSTYLNDIIKLNLKYKDRVFSKFGIVNNYPEINISGKLFVKTGIWLSYFNRNLFKYFKICSQKNVRVISNARVIKIFLNKDQSVQRIKYKKDNKTFDASFDFYFLATGAFESTRILMASDILSKDKIQFSDHLSQKVFKIKGSTIINDIDFAFKVKGASLITKRIIGEIDGISFFANPIFNSEFPFFDNLKKLLFQRSLSIKIVLSIFKDFPSFMKFIWYLLFLRKLYVYKNEWYLNIDIENYVKDNYIKLSEDEDKFKESAVDVNFNLDNKISLIFEKAENLIEEFLINNNVNYEKCFSKIEMEKYEDTYHPFGLFCNFNSINEYYNKFPNMLVVSTGILPRAGGINLTAAVFPLIEDFILEHMPQ